MVVRGIFDGLPYWWVVFLSVSLIIAALVAIVVPLGIASLMWSERRAAKKREKDGEGANLLDDEPLGPLDQESWIPKLDKKEWNDVSQFEGCPWNFEGCEDVGSVLERIWRPPLNQDLQSAYEALKPRVKNVSVMRIVLAHPKERHWMLVYTLLTGAELFGGAPREHAIGLDLGDAKPGDDCEVDEISSTSTTSSGLRHRGAVANAVIPNKKDPTTMAPLILPCLSPFYRIHDGFGVLLSAKHLPVLASNPNDTVHGSCYYVYPARGLTSVARKPHLVKFARVDKNCVACADRRNEVPRVVYVEKGGQDVEDDEPLMSFVADTVSNIAGQRVVPPAYMGGPGSTWSGAGGSEQI